METTKKKIMEKYTVLAGIVIMGAGLGITNIILVITSKFFRIKKIK